MKNFEPLYCLDKKGRIRVFKIKVIEDDSNNTEEDELFGNISKSAIIVSGTGLLEGKLTKKTKTISKGKNIGKANETTPYEQAILEAQSKWNDKLDEGYKSDKMVFDVYFVTYKEAIERNFIDTVYNTNSDWHEKPMLAEPVKKVKQLSFPAYIQPKLNGIRCMAKYVNGEVLLMSRGGKYYTIPHLQEALKSIFVNLVEPVIFDGEIFNKDYDLQSISGIGREELGEKDKSFLQYHIYDIAIRSYPQVDRINILQDIFNTYITNNRNILFPVSTIPITKEEEIKKYHDKFVQLGYEGAIVRPKYGKYWFGFRDKDLIKVKEFIDEEFELIGCKISEGQSIGDSFVFELKNNINEDTFFARPRGTREMKENWYNKRDWLGKSATVRYQERTADKLPHQAHVVVIRDYE